MNEQLINWIWNNSKVTTPQDALVLLALAQHCGLTGEATVKVAELSRMTRLSDNEVRQALRAAVRVKEIGILQNVDPYNGVRLTNTYRFLVFRRPPSKDEVNGVEENIEFDEPETLPGINVPKKVADLPKPTQPKIMMDTLQLDMIAADPLYRGLDVRAQAMKFKRWARAQVPPAEETVKRFKVWLSKV
jgi:hypothetical protein